MKKHYFLKNLFYAVVFFSGTGLCVAQITEDFDSGLSASYTTGSQVLTSGTWTTANVLRESSGDSRGGSGAAARINDDTAGAHLTTPALSGAGTVTFWYRELNSGGGTFNLQKSTDGVSYTTIASQAFSGTTYTQFTFDVDDSSSNLTLRILNDDQSGHLIIDDFDVTAFSGPGITLGAVSGNTTESGGTATFTVALAQQPTLDVVVNVSSGDTGEVTINAPTALTFTNANWDTTQTVTVTGVDDGLVDGDVDVTVTIAVDDGLSDDSYDGLSTTTTVTNADNDGPTTIYSENFTGQNGQGAVGPTPTIDVSGVDWTVDISSTNLSASTDWFQVVSEVFEARDIDGDAIWMSPSVDISNYTNVSFSLSAAESGGMESGDIFVTEYRVDSGTWTEAASNGSLNDDFTSATVSQTGLNGSTLEIRVTMNNGADSERHRLDDILVEGTDIVTATWQGDDVGSPTDWGTAVNWDTDAVPTTLNHVVIPDLTSAPIISSSTGAEAKNLTITETDGVTITGGGSLRVSGTSSGNITYNRTLGTTNWYLVGIPVAGETIEDMISNNSFATGTGSNIGWAPYDNSQASASDRWDYQTAASTGSLTSGGGYSVKLASSGTLAFTGTMPTADVGVSITDNSGGSGNAFNLIGNPYPSFIAANGRADGTNNLLKVNDIDNDYLSESTLWFWNQATNSYDIVNNASGAFFIAPGQAFFVSASGNHQFSFTEAMQSHQTSDTFKSSDNRPEINLVMTNGSDERDADIFYIDGTSTGFDNGYDSSIFEGVANEFAIYTHTLANGTGRNLGIQSLPNNDFENMVIPVGINASSGLEITISANAVNLPSGIKVFLEDKDDNSFTELTSTSNFVTTLSSDLNGIGRFYIHTSTEALSIDDVNLNNISMYKVDSQTFRIVGVSVGSAQVHMFNILGARVMSTSFLGDGMNDIPLPNLKTGIYIVQLKTDAGTLNKKVIIE